MRKNFLIILTFFSLTAFTQTPLRSLLGADTAAGGGCDADAQKFIDSAGITDATQQSAICQLVVDLKAASIWTKFYAIYPIVGGTETTSKWNLKDPRDLDAAYRLTFVGGTASPPNFEFSGINGSWTPGANGGKTSAQTHFINSTNGTPSSLSMSFYSRTNRLPVVNEREMGAIQAAGKYDELFIRYTDGNGYYQADHFNTGATAAVGDSRGFFVGSRTSTTSNSLYRNGTSLNTNTTLQASSPTTIQMYLCAINNDGATSFGTQRECAFASIGQGLTSGEVTSFYNAVQAYQTTLGRQL